MEHKYFYRIKPIISNIICNTVVRCKGRISSQALNELSNIYTDKIIERIIGEDIDEFEEVESRLQTGL